MNTSRPFLIITLSSFKIPYTFIQLLLFGIVLFNLLKQSIKLIELTERYETEFDNLHGMLDWNQSSSNRTIAFDWFVDWICTPGSKVLSLFSPRFVDEFTAYLAFTSLYYYRLVVNGSWFRGQQVSVDCLSISRLGRFRAISILRDLHTLKSWSHSHSVYC